MENYSIGYVICEGATIQADTKIVTESNDRVIAEAIVQTADETNRNGRLYRRADLEREISCPRTMELLKTGNFLGHDSHPTDTSLAVQQTIDPNKCSTQFLKFWMDGNNVMAHYRGWVNELGANLDKCLRQGDSPSWSLRALGTISNKSGVSVVENLRLITYDRVIYPSHTKAYTTKLISESANVKEVNESANSLLIPITNEKVINYIKTESCNLKSIFNNFDTLYESMTIINNGRDVQLMDKAGNLFIVNIESYISDEIMNYCANV